jgi:MFS family permease
MTTTTSQPQSRKASSNKPGTTVLLTAVAYFMVTLDTLVVVTALPSIHRSFGGGIATLQWTVSAYTIAFGAGILSAAAIGDRLGRRRVYVVGLALFTAASAACALAPDVSVLIAFRAIQGIGAAIVMPLSLTILTSAFPTEKRGAVVGIWGGIAGVAVAAGPLIGGGITQALSWHWIFWVNVPIGVAATVGAALRLPERHGPTGPARCARARPRLGWRRSPHLGPRRGRSERLGHVAEPDRVATRHGDARRLRLVGRSGT